MSEYEARDKLLEKKNVRGTYIREVDGEDVIVAMVGRKVPESELDEADIVDKELEIDGQRLKTQVEEVHVPHGQDSHRERHRPAPGGVSIGNIRRNAGTMTACRLQDEQGRDVTLTNRHVAGMGATVYQPSLMDGGSQSDRIGDVVEVSEFDEDGTNICDSALIKLDNPEYLDEERILELGDLTGWAEAESGHMYDKSGRTSGVSSNGFRGRDARVNVTYGDRTLFFTGVEVFGYMSEPGDSGSLITYLDDVGDRYGTSLLFAGSDRVTLAIPMSTVQEVHGELTIVRPDEDDGDDGDDDEEETGLPWWLQGIASIFHRFFN